MDEEKQFSFADAEHIGNALGIDWTQFGVEQFRNGIAVELDHDGFDHPTSLTPAEALITGRIALAHLKEHSDYYLRATKMEKEADDYWANV